MVQSDDKLGIMFKESESKSYDSKLIEALKETNRPCSTIELSFQTGIPHSRVVKKMKRLSKYKLVKRVTAIDASKIGYWILNDKKINKRD